MNIFKQWYLRLFKGWWLMDEMNMLTIKAWYWSTDRTPDIIQVGKDRYMVGPPRKRA